MKKETIEFFCDRCGLQVLEYSLNLIEITYKTSYNRKEGKELCTLCTDMIDRVLKPDLLENAKL